MLCIVCAWVGLMYEIAVICCISFHYTHTYTHTHARTYTHILTIILFVGYITIRELQRNLKYPIMLR